MAKERYEHCMVEWYWSAPIGTDPSGFKPSFTIFFTNNQQESRDGGAPQLTTFLSKLGQEGWHITSSVTSSNWILWTLERKVMGS